MKKDTSNSLHKRFLAKLLVLCLAVGLLPTVSLAVSGLPLLVNDDPYYTITVDTFTGGTVHVDYTEAGGSRTQAVLSPGQELYAEPGTEVKISIEPDKEYFIANAHYIMNDTRVGFTARDQAQMEGTIDDVTGDITLGVQFHEKYSISAPKYENGKVTYSQYGVFYRLGSGETVDHAIDPTEEVLLMFTADDGYLVGSNTYYTVGDGPSISFGFAGDRDYGEKTIQEDEESFGDITVVPEFVKIVPKVNYSVWADRYNGANVIVTRTVDGVKYYTYLRSGFSCGVPEGTEITITIIPDWGSSVRSDSFYTMGGARYGFNANDAVNVPVSQTVTVTGNVAIYPRINRGRPPYEQQYGVNLANQVSGLVSRDHVTAYAGEIVTFTVIRGVDVEDASVTTFSGKPVPVTYQGINTINDGRVYSFIMPADTVTISISYKPSA